MKKKKEKFRQPKQKKHRNHHLRFLTKLILLLLFVAVGMGVYYSYQLFFIPVHQEVKNEDKGLTKEQKEVKQEREELEKQEQENKTSIDYIADGSQEKDESVGKISDESDALNALKALQGELGIADAEEEYQVSEVKELKDLTVYEMQQYYEGIEVYGRSLMISVDESGNLQSVNGTYEQPSNVAVEPKIQEYDAREAVEAYLKENEDMDSSEDSESSYSLQSQGYVICFNENNAAEAGYLFFIVMGSQNTPTQQIFVSGKTGEILADNSLILTEKVSGTLQGQKSSQTLDYDKQGDEFKLWDEERNIQVYRTTSSEFLNVYVNCDEIQWKTGETPDAGAVDTLANLQKAYDYYKDTFGRDGITNDKNVKLDAIVGIQNVREGNEVTDFRDNAAMSGTDTMLIGQKTDGSATYAAELDVMGHEFNHGVVNGMSTLLQGVYSDNNARQRSSQLAMGEGLADIFGEFV